MRRMKFGAAAMAGTAAAVCVAIGAAGADGLTVDWAYNGGPAGDHFTPLSQINAGNVGQLKPAWRFDFEAGGLQAQPLVIRGVLYGPTPSGKLVALDAATGVPKWTFDPGFQASQPIRGLTSHGSGAQMRVLYAVMSYLYALDPATGKPIPSFGAGGRIDLRENLRGTAEENGFFVTSPGSVYRDLYIVSGRVSESTPASPGDVRAFDVRTGKLRWTFHTVPHPGEVGAETWGKDAHLTQGGANAWTGQVVDEKRGIVFLATGSAADDFYGAERPGDNRFANSLIALDANTGKRLWDFQAVRHDIWDMDFAAPPVLLTVVRDGKKIDAVAATNKLSYVYLFERTTGRPLFPIQEVAVPASTVPGEIAARTQPVPTAPKALSWTSVGVDDLTTRTPAANVWARDFFAALNGGGKQFTPMTIGKETLVLAGFIGGVEWGGMAADPKGVLYANATRIPGVSSIVESQSLLSSGVGEGAYRTQCAGCHGMDLKGSPPMFPSVADLKARMSEAELADVIKNGRGRMPAFGNLPPATIANLVSYLRTGEDLPGAERPAISLQGRFAPSKTQYTSTGNRQFIDPDGYPGVKPPWGTLNAIDMTTGKYLWTVPFGVTGTMGPAFGGSNTGGPVITASGLLFIGATTDRKLHAYDTRTGKLLWEAALSAPAQATPAVYMVEGRQYVVVAASARRQGGRVAANQDNSQAVTTGAAQGGYVAFALPK
jgi:quinoprotein glucose dehydrogenase